MALTEYRQKRDFSKTPEPSGKQRIPNKGALRFVVHKHHASRLHWDLRLELDGALKSWAIPKGPSLDPEEKRLAVMVEDHPIDYQYFEGVIPEGSYGAGPVMIWDRGTYHAYGDPHLESSEEAIRKGLEKGHITFILEGHKLKGEFALIKLKKGKGNDWLLLKKRDGHATSDAPPDSDRSVSTGRTLEEITAGAPAFNSIDLSDAPRSVMPAGIKPMLASLVSAPFDRPGWLFEIKWDGYRCMAEITKEGVRLYSRNRMDLNVFFPSLVQALSPLPFDAVLDGEVVVIDAAGKADFQMLQNYLKSPSGALIYYVFDIPYLNGHDLTSLPLMRRKEILRRILPNSPVVRFNDHLETEGISFFEAAIENGVEGIVAKDGNSPYKPGQRSRDWLKIKTQLRQETVIAGFTQPREGRKGFGSLILGVYEEETFSYVGHVGTGFTDETLGALHSRLKKMARGESPFPREPKVMTPVTWVEPKIVCEVRFREWTKDGLMRHPVFVGLREDKDPKDVRREIPEPAPSVTNGRFTEKKESAPKRGRANLASINDSKVRLTNLDKVFWPEEGWTKGDVIDYYRRISPYILPYLTDRPESLHRFPDGIAGEAFFQKDMHGTAPPWVHTISLQSEGGRKNTTYLVCQDEATLVYMANLGCIEVHPWHSRIDRIEYPDYMILDLDPLDVPFWRVVETATVTREVLEEIGAWGFCKTSGATGLHVCVPLGAKYTYSQTVQFARLINLLVHSRLPDSTSLERNPDERRGKVYLDYLQNGRAQTIVAPYSIRPRKGAPVSTPLLWEEVAKDLDPGRFTFHTIFSRTEQLGDLWDGVLGRGIDMDGCLARLDDVLKA